MNTKRILFWLGFLIVLGLIVWGLVVAMNKAPGSTTPTLKTPAPVSEADHILGTSTAPVTLMEYGDFQCPACAAYYPVVKQLMSEASTTMRLVFRNFPLSQHVHAESAAAAAEAAGKQGKYWEMFDLLYDTQKDWENLSFVDGQAKFKEYAKKLELDLAKYDLDVKSDETKAKIKTDRDNGVDIGVSGTPTFFINGKSIVTPPSYESFKNLILAAATSTSN